MPVDYISKPDSVPDDLVIGDPILSDKCVYVCDISTGCGSGASSCSIFDKRDYATEASTPQSAGYTLWNETAQEYVQVSSDEYTAELIERSVLVKRWDENDKKGWNRASIGKYLFNQFHPQGKPVEKFGKTRSIVTGFDMATVSQQATFNAKTKPFQLGSGGLHGCTVLTIISRRAVYMAHYWEVHALNRDDDLSDGSQGLANFQSRVEFTLTGDKRKDSATKGVGVRWDWFNKDGDNTRILIMSPYKDEFKPPTARYKTRKQDLEYPNKVQEIINLLKVEGRIPNAAAVIQGYQRLNYSWDRNALENVGPDANDVDRSERGIACFQYNGDKTYRLFYEHVMYWDTDSVAG
ncbi:hypothetical protein ACHAPH_003346 [Verticillium nonalfalfae]